MRRRTGLVRTGSAGIVVALIAPAASDAAVRTEPLIASCDREPGATGVSGTVTPDRLREPRERRVGRGAADQRSARGRPRGHQWCRGLRRGTRAWLVLPLPDRSDTGARVRALRVADRADGAAGHDGRRRSSDGGHERVDHRRIRRRRHRRAVARCMGGGAERRQRGTGDGRQDGRVTSRSAGSRPPTISSSTSTRPGRTPRRSTPAPRMPRRPHPSRSRRGPPRACRPAWRRGRLPLRARRSQDGSASPAAPPPSLLSS